VIDANSLSHVHNSCVAVIICVSIPRKQKRTVNISKILTESDAGLFNIMLTVYLIVRV
jgi:hypothetical protein